MAYTPSAQTKAVLDKMRRMGKTGEKLTPAEQALATTHSQRMIADMAPRVSTGGGGAYDYGAGTTGGYGYGMNEPFKSGSGMEYLNPSELAKSYQNFQEMERIRQAQGLPPRPMPAQFSQIASPAGMSSPINASSIVNNPNIQAPVQGSLGYDNLVKAGIISASGQVQAQPMPGSGYNYINQTPPPQQNPGLPQSSNPTQVNTNPTATLPFNPADALPSAPVTVRTPNGGLALGNSVAGIDEGKLLAEAELQKSLRQQTYGQQVSGRKAMLDELSQVLQKQQAAALGDQMPGIYEDLNTRGLLRSSALGEKVGLEASKLARQTSEQLALQGITDRNLAINDLSGIEDAYLGGRGSAMQRRFSLEDFDRQIAAGERLGANALPQVSQPSGKGSGALQGGLGGATVGGTVGGAPGAAIGGVIGAIGGGKLGSK